MIEHSSKTKAAPFKQTVHVWKNTDLNTFSMAFEFLYREVVNHVSLFQSLKWYSPDTALPPTWEEQEFYMLLVLCFWIYRFAHYLAKELSFCFTSSSSFFFHLVIIYKDVK